MSPCYQTHFTDGATEAQKGAKSLEQGYTYLVSSGGWTWTQLFFVFVCLFFIFLDHLYLKIFLGKKVGNAKHSYIKTNADNIE